MAIPRAGSQFDDSGWAATPNLAHERHWRFRVADSKSHPPGNGADYFEKRASELAAALGCRLMAMKNVRLEMSPAKVWMVTGIVLLEHPRENVPAGPKVQA